MTPTQLSEQFFSDVINIGDKFLAFLVILDQFQRHRHQGMTATPSTNCCDKKYISGRRGRTRPPMMLLEPP